MVDVAKLPADEIERRRRVRSRLKRVKGKLGELEVRLEALHADRSGVASLCYKTPLIPDEYHHLGLSVGRIAREAGAGCDLATDWMQETEEQRAHIDHLRATPLSKRAPDYDGPWLTPAHAARMGKPARKPYWQTKSAAEMAAERMERAQARRARGRALLEEFLAETDSLH